MSSSHVPITKQNSESHLHGSVSPSMSYVDLKKGLENLLPIKDRSDPGYTRFLRHFPEIVIESPESVTTSMPDIHSALHKSSLKKPLFSIISEANCSCPDLRNGSLYKHDDESDIEDVFPEYDDSENHSDYSDGILHDSEPDSQHKPDLARTTRRKKDAQPVEMLRKNFKQKHSRSLYYLPNQRRPENDLNYDSYYTVHGKNDLTHHSPSAYTSSRHFDYQFVNPKQNHRVNYPSMDRLGTFHPPHHNYHHHHHQQQHQSVYGPVHQDYAFYSRSHSSPHGNLNQSSNNFNTIHETEVVYKCCCGGVNCKKVVPIFDYLETYFEKTVRFFILKPKLRLYIRLKVKR